jgi:hypothetical protein
MIKNSRTVLGFKPVHGLRRAGEASPRAVARWLAARPSSHPAKPARAWCRALGSCAPPMVTARWPCVWRRAGAAGGVQPGDEVRGIRWGQLAWEEGGDAGQGGTGGDALRRRYDDGAERSARCGDVRRCPH